MSKKRNKDIPPLDINRIKFYYGIPHSHSSYSTGRGTPIELYEYAAKCHLDFLFITDHNDFLNSHTSLKDDKLTKWQASTYMLSKARKNLEEFIPILGFECKTSSYGDFNIINAQNYFIGPVKDLKVLLLWMINNPSSFVSINHPHKNIIDMEYDPILNKIITSIEVCNGNPSSKITYHEKYYFTLLDKGWQLGAINGQDNHRINFDDCENLTVCIGNDLTKQSIIHAFRCHRTYSTESKFLKLYFTINDVFMGDSISPNYSKLKFLIFAEDIKYRIKEIQIISNNTTIVKKIENINLNSIKYMYEHTGNQSETWYVIKLFQENGRVALSSPIFISDSEE